MGKGVKNDIFERKYSEEIHSTMKDQQEDRKIKIIWDFRGPDAARTAEHHALHLKEYIKTNEIKLNITGFEDVGKNYSIAWMVVHEAQL
ncbi:MAG: hypothetical protein WBL27_00360, partial [Salinimicrobium sp.]